MSNNLMPAITGKAITGRAITGVVDTDDTINSDIMESEHGDNPRVNLRTSRLSYTEQGISAGMNSYVISVSPLYLSNMNTKAPRPYSGMPEGWMLDAHQYIVNRSNEYIFSDAGGYEHKLRPIAQTSFYISDNSEYRLDTTNPISCILTDRKGNRLIFDVAGRMKQFQSCHNAAIIKHYNYDTTGRLIRIYDQRNGNQNTANPRIEFTYSNGLLSSMFVRRSSGTRERLNLNYTNQRLTGIRQQNGGIPAANGGRLIRRFSYTTTGFLSEIESSETRQGVLIAYTQNKATRLTNGTFNASNFTEITHTAFDYNSITSGVKITDEKGICGITYLNRRGYIVSALESTDGGLRTLSKDTGVAVTPIDGTLLPENINDIQVRSSTIFFKFNDTQDINVANDENEKTWRHFALTAWVRLRHNAFMSQRVKAHLTYRVAHQLHSSEVEIDGLADNCWQKISLPIELPKATSNTIYTNRVRLQNLSIFYPNGLLIPTSIANCRIVPSGRVRSFCGDPQHNQNNNEVRVDSINNVVITYTSDSGKNPENFNNRTSDEIYFTAKDLLATRRNIVSRHSDSDGFDAVCNNGRRTLSRIDNISLTGLNRHGESRIIQLNEVCYQSTDAADGSVEFVERIAGDLEVAKFVRNGNNMTQRQFTQHNRRGLLISEREFNRATTTYGYSEFGDLTRISSSGTSNSGIVKEIRYKNEYRELENELDERRHRDGVELRTSYTYTPDDLLNSVTSPNGQTTAYDYHAETQNLTSVSSSVNGQKNENEINYHPTTDRVETMSHGNNNPQYRFTYDNRGDISEVRVGNTPLWNREFTQGDSNNNFADTQQITWGNGEVLRTETDKYGRLSKQFQNGEEKVTYTYGDGNSEQLAHSNAALTKVSDGFAGLDYTIKYNQGNGAISRIDFTGETHSGSIVRTNDGIGRLTDVRYGFDKSNPEDVVDYAYDYDDTIQQGLERVTLKDKFDTYHRIDNQGRVQFKTLTAGGNNRLRMSDSFTYLRSLNSWGGNVGQTHFVSEIRQSINRTYTHEPLVATSNYEYDANGNITNYNIDNPIPFHPFNIDRNIYEYDALGRVTRDEHRNFRFGNPNASELLVNNRITYDERGNITSKIEWRRNPGRDFAIEYHYDNPNWRDQLTRVGHREIRYDAVGNPTTYLDRPMTWTRGNKLASYQGHTFRYNADGYRTFKQDSHFTTTYHLDGSRILRETVKGLDGTFLRSLDYYYDQTGICGFKVTSYRWPGPDLVSAEYYFLKNAQGDVTHVYDIDGRLMGTYSYDAWGVCTIEQNPEDRQGIIRMNPFRYRGYYFDNNISLYYLNSRYYDPEIGRFISPDGVQFLEPIVSNGLNLYAYCGNNPVMNVDPNGTNWLRGLGNALRNAAQAVGSAVSTAARAVYNHVIQPVATWANDSIIQPIYLNVVRPTVDWVYENVYRPVADWVYNNVYRPAADWVYNAMSIFDSPPPPPQFPDTELHPWNPPPPATGPNALERAGLALTIAGGVIAAVGVIAVFVPIPGARKVAAGLLGVGLSILFVGLGFLGRNYRLPRQFPKF